MVSTTAAAISEYITDIWHRAGKDNMVDDYLSRAQVGSRHLGVVYAAMAEDQLADPEIQVFRSAATGLQLEDVEFLGSGVTLLCDVSTGQPCPMVPAG